jgi:hypothetical protein
MGEEGLAGRSAGAGTVAEKTDATAAPETMKEAAAAAAQSVRVLLVNGGQPAETLRISLGAVTFLQAKGLQASGRRLLRAAAAYALAPPMQCTTRSATRERSTTGACLTIGTTLGSARTLR